MPTTMQLIAKQTIGAGGAASVTFSSIPQTFTDLKIVMSWRNTTQAVQQSNAHLTFNGQTSRYYERLLFGTGVSNGSVGRDNTFPYITWSGSGNGASTTANTFGSTETYICNYTTSNPKSISSDSVTENNAADAWIIMNTALWNPVTNAPITSITITADTGAIAEFSEFTLYGISNSTTTQNPTTPSAIGGDVIITDGSFWYHAFKYSGSFTPLKDIEADVLVVAGGGGGGQDSGGGGGAGGLLAFTAQALTSANNYTCTIGAGGVGSQGYGTTQGGVTQTNGNDSRFGSLTLVKGGGYGGGIGIGTYPGPYTPGSGGSGGGSAGGGGGTGASPSVSGQGFAGGNGFPSGGGYPAGGGGGAGGVGQSYPNTSTSGAGGIGATSALINTMGAATTTGQLSGGNYYYAGGGGGWNGAGTSGAGGLGGGGAGSGSRGDGTPNTGGGGGGGTSTAPAAAGFGGSGIIIVRYAV
jgi:hypothetical protein